MTNITINKIYLGSDGEIIKVSDFFSGLVNYDVLEDPNNFYENSKRGSVRVEYFLNHFKEYPGYDTPL